MKDSSNPRVAKLICFGYGGDTVHYSRNCSSHGYGNPERPHAADPTTITIPDGTPVVDIRPAVDRSAGAVVSLPLVDVDLPRSKSSRLGEISPLFAVAMVDNTFGSLLSLHEAQHTTGEKYGALDSVAIDIYVDLAHKCGARIGHYENNVIIWN